MYDVLLKNGKIIDGTGNNWYLGDIAIDGESIVKIFSHIDASSAKQVIDAKGKYVVPGFIDIHTHSDATILACPTGDSQITQGVTTALGGHCGFSMAPVLSERLAGLKKFMNFMPAEPTWDWVSMGDLLEYMSRSGCSMNFACLVGQGTLRIAAIGFEQRLATADELETMKNLLAEALDQGAVGMSMGLVYSPGSFAPKEEILELAKIIAAKGKFLTAHIRDEGDKVEESVQEVLDIAIETGVSLQICHLKAQGKLNWHKTDNLFKMIEDCRAKGVDVTFDVYPYPALNTLLTALLPGWAQNGGVDGMVERFQSTVERNRLLPELEPIAMKYGGWENVVIASVKDQINEWIQGKSIAQIAEIKNISPGEAMLDALVADKCSIMCVCYCMNEDNVIRTMQHPLAMIGSDGKILTLDGVLAVGKPHPRNYGTYPRFIGRYVRDRKIMTLPEAIRKITSAPAQRMGIKDRGLLKEGMKADIVIFDLDTIIDKSTFEYPQQFSTGIETVIVNGILTINKGEHTGALNGTILR